MKNWIQFEFQIETFNAFKFHGMPKIRDLLQFQSLSVFEPTVSAAKPSVSC